MQGRESLFLKISLILYISLGSNLISGCGNPTLWDGDLEEARLRLRRSDFSFLRHVDFERVRLEEMFRLGDGAGYYMHFVFRQLGLDEVAERSLDLEWERGKGVWREEAALLLLERLARSGEYPALEKRARRFRSDFKDSIHRGRASRLLLEALYWQEKDREVLAMLDRPEEPGRADDAEQRLFRAVSSCRLGLEGWPALFLSLFLQERASTIHARALSFLQLEERLSRFSPEQADLFRAKALLVGGKNAEAIEILEKRLPSLASQPSSSSILISELSTAYFATGDLSRGARFLSGLAPRLAAAQELEALEMAGRLYRKDGEREKAERLLAEVIGRTTDPVQRDRAIWFTLDLHRQNGIEAALPHLGRLAALWSDPGYFADILDEGITDLVRRGGWTALEDLYRRVSPVAPAYQLARLSYLLGRLRWSGLAGSPRQDAQDAAGLLRQARDLQPDGYYGLLASTLLDEWPPPFGGAGPGSPEADPGTGLPPVDPPAPVRRASEVELVRGFFRFGLPLEGYRRVQQAASDLPAQEILAAARELQERGLHLESIRLTSLLLSRREREAAVRAEADRQPGAPQPGAQQPAAQQTGARQPGVRRGAVAAAELLEQEALELMYPRAYLPDIERQAREIGLENAVLFALVREESHFDPRIVSRAGAVGLTQLMPETARDMARRLRVEASDLTDPQLNLLLGSRHFGGLLERLEDIPKSLMAYNAGLSRVREWERRYSALPMDLFAEAIPYAETRHYLRKILVSAVYYAHLYQDRPPAETVKRFFPRL